MYGDAVKFYEQAYKVGMYEVLSFEVLLPLGRAYFLNNENEKAFDALEEFLKEAGSELSVLRPWDLTPEGEKALRRNIERAEQLINLYK